MTSVTVSKTERINLRLQSAAKQVIEKAASFEGKTVSSFILNSAVHEAERTVREHERMALFNKDAEIFFNALSKPVQFNDRLRKAFAEHENRIISK